MPKDESGDRQPTQPQEKGRIVELEEALETSLAPPSEPITSRS